MNIDYTKLTRDYRKFPVIKTNRGNELIPEQDLRYIYFELNMSIKESCSFFCVGRPTFQKWINIYSLKKPKELHKQQVRNSLRKNFGENYKETLKEKHRQTVLKKYSVTSTNYLPEVMEKRRQNNLEKYGVTNPSMLQEIKDKIRQNNLKKYGCSVNSLKEKKERCKETCLEKYGVTNPSQNSIVQDKIKNTFLIRYGITHPSKLPNYIEKIKLKSLEKYGTEKRKDSQIWQDFIKLREEDKLKHFPKELLIKYYIQENLSKQETCEKLEISLFIFHKLLKYYSIKKSYILQRNAINSCCSETKFKRYGDSNYNNREKWRETCLKRYGENPLQNIEIQNKRKKTCMEKYGFSNHFKCLSIIKKGKETNRRNHEGLLYTQTQEYKDLIKSKLGEIQTKIYQTKKKNNSFNTSKAEQEILVLLQSRYPDTKYQYMDTRYPFNCDFYIPSIDLFIEYHGSWTHGFQPFVGTREQLELINLWRKKSLETNFKGKPKAYYKNVIYTWTVLDVKKRALARENNLNYLEFFNIQQFMEWFDKL